jgi:transcription-repair coupling factor (superfamily II helicase)
MFYERIQDYLSDSNLFTSLSDSVLNGNPIQIGGINRSARAMLISDIFHRTQKNIVVVSGDNRLAEEYQEDLSVLNNRTNVWTFPDYETLPYEERSPHYNIRSQRIETLSQIFTNEKNIYSLSINSFIRKITPPELFENHIFYLEKGNEIELDKFLSKLVSLGYNSEYQVVKVGEFAHRGGIIDIFSPHFSFPIRIELFGDEIDSLKYFRTSTQRSFGNEIESIKILPMREFSIYDVTADEKFWEKIHTQGFYEGIEQDLPFLLPELKSFLDYFERDDVILFFDDYHYFPSFLEEIKADANELFIKKKTENKKKILAEPSQLYCFDAEFKNLLRDKNQIFFSDQKLNEESIYLDIPIISQSLYHNNLALFEENLKKQISEGFRIFIQSDNKSQSKRMQDILGELADNIHFSIGGFQKGFIIQNPKIAIYTDHEIFDRYKKRKYSSKYAQENAIVDFESLKPGDFVVHVEYGIGLYEGLQHMKINGNVIECLKLRYADNDRIYLPTHQLKLISRFVSEENIQPVIHKLGSKKWENQKARARKQIELVADDLVKLYANRQLKMGVKFEKDTVWQKEMEDAFIYEETPDQLKSIREIKEDMESNRPMERLLCGDVGFGKTEVAVRAAFKAVVSGFQVAVLVPTTLLAEQHYNVFKDRLAQYPVNIAMFSRFRSKSEIKKDLVKLMEGEVDIVIGTHRILSKDVNFKKLGLLIIDEEHRFGVRSKDKLRKIKNNVDTLYMSATPIPRTLNMAISKIKEMSLIQTSPKARFPIRTIIISYEKEIIKDAIKREVERGGQVFFIHNRVQTIDSIADDLRNLLPKVKIEVGHGQMKEKELEKVMIDFAHHKFDVLIATTIIENGIDIANANTIIINRADTFGLAQLYQIRGRVGRSDRRAYAYFIIPKKMNEMARKRLETLTEYNTLGSGYQIAMRDLELRGAGTLLGTKQSGIINTVGFNFYNRMLEQAITNIQNGKTDNIWEENDHTELKDFSISNDYYFPEEYIRSEKIRLDIYKRMLDFKEENDFYDLMKELKDRFGELPKIAKQTIRYYLMRNLSEKAKLAKFKLKSDKAVFEFDNKYLPSRENITALLRKFNYPVSFDTTKNFTLKLTLTDDYDKNIKSSINILKFIISWNS